MASRVAFIAFTRRGCELACTLAAALAGEPGWRQAGTSVHGPGRYAGLSRGGVRVEAYGSLDGWTRERFADSDALVFVGAAGIAVRAIAAHLRDKFSDPAVVSVDEAGSFSVPLLSGHVGGANGLARTIARLAGGQTVVSTATDVNGLFAVDEWARSQGLSIVERELAKRVSSRLLDGAVVGFHSEFRIAGDVPGGLEEGVGELGLSVSFSDTLQPFPETLHLVVRGVVVGVGCRKGCEPAELAGAVEDALEDAGVSGHAVDTLATIDVKREEPAVLELARIRGWRLRFFSAEELAAVPGSFESSDFVAATVGVGNVCERAAVLGAAGRLIAGKRVAGATTVALAARPFKLAWP